MDDRLRVLVVEDDHDTASIISSFIEYRYDATVALAGDYSSAREKLRGGDYDIVTLDLRLAGGDGMEILDRIRSMDRSPRVIVVTGHGDEELASLALRRGASGYVVKGGDISARLAEAMEKASSELSLETALNQLDFERRQLLSIFDGIDEPVYVSDPDTYELLYVNNAIRQLFGDCLGEICYRRFQGRDSPCDFCTNDRILGENEGRTYVWEHHNPVLGRWFRCIDKALRWPDGRTVRYEMAIDITEKKKAEEALLEEEYFTESALDALPDAFVVFGLDRRPLRWNAAFRDMTGYSDEEIESMRSIDFFAREDIDRVEVSFGRVMESGAPEYTEATVRRKDGSMVPATLSGARLLDREGNPVALSGVGRDMTDQKKAEAALHNIITETNQRREEITSLLESTRFVLEHQDLHESARQVFSLCKKLIGAESGYIAIIDRDEGESEILFMEPAERRPGFESLGKMPLNRLTRKALTTKKAVLDNDYASGERPEDLPEAHFSIGNVLFAPLVIDGEANGIIGLANKPGGFSSRDALMASAFGEIASLAFSNIRSKERLQESEIRYRQLVETAPDVIYTLSSDGRILSLNPAFERITGWSREHWESRPFVDIIHPDDLPLALATFQKASSGGTPPPYELRIMSESGEYLAGEFTSAPYVVEGEVAGEFGMVRDITERRRAEEELQRTNAELARYAHTVSHDLRGPLSNVLAASVTLKALLEGLDIEDEQVMELSSIIENNVAKCSTLIEDLLTLAESGQEPRDLQQVEVGRVVNQILSESTVEIKEKGIEVRVDDDLGTLAANPTQIYQVFSNLIRNAVKHNNSENPVITVSMLDGAESRGYRYLVRDNGSGIPEEIIDDIFLPFYKGEQGQTGIGLVTVKKIVETYGGEIRAYNEDGACFEFTLKPINSES